MDGVDTPSAIVHLEAASRKERSDLTRPRLDALFQAFLRLVLRVFFRGVEIVGLERLPAGSPMVLVANHVNGLIDPALLLGALPVHPRLLAKSTLWKNPVVRPWVELAGSIPVYRRQDEVDTVQNEETFARCHELLAQGGALALFPEGKSHNEPALQPLKTGLARIVLGAEAKHPGLGTRIVPVGLTFAAREKFRSRVLVQIGRPIDPSLEAGLGGLASSDAVRALTSRVADALEEVTLNYSSWEDAQLLARAAEMYGRAELYLPGRRRLAEGFPIQKAFIEGYEDLKRRFPEKVAAVAAAVRSYDRLLRAFRLRDDQVAAAYPPFPVLRFAGRTLLRLLIHLPLAVLGTVINWIPYRLIGVLATRLAGESSDQTATLKLMGAVLLFPLNWSLAAALAVHWTGTWWAAPAALLLAPVSGYAALLFDEHRARFWDEARAYLVLRTRRRKAEGLRSCRREVLEQVAALETLWRGGGKPG
jgi:glycerol-3-phosphate O-acyltransferase/dihydroxyacetone phosphate acyltransferase